MSEAILAVESSCDETAVALVSEHNQILFERLSSQVLKHKAFGGVVPEVASRLHFDEIDLICSEALNFAREHKISLKAVAATRGPGLIGPLLVGSSYAEGLSQGLGLPLIGVHHLRGHLASCLLDERLPGKNWSERSQYLFPAIVVLVSGGHTQILSVSTGLEAQAHADTADDAAGECFDKSAKLMGLPYPGGPEIEKMALKVHSESEARALAADLPRPRSAQGFSFSGLKTAIRLKIEKQPELKSSPEFAWAVQEAIAETLLEGLSRVYKSLPKPPGKIIFCGGVAANKRVRHLLQEWAQKRSLELYLPPLKYCTDNAVMIGVSAWVQNPRLHLSECVARIPL